MAEEEKEKEGEKSVLDGDLEKAGVVSEEPFKEDKEREESTEEKTLKDDMGDETADVYSEGGREDAVEHGEIEPWEEGFVEGAEGQEQKGVHGACPTCGKPLGDRDEGVIEREIDGEKVFFCCDKCASEYESKVPPEKRGE